MGPQSLPDVYNYKLRADGGGGFNVSVPVKFLREIGLVHEATPKLKSEYHVILCRDVESREIAVKFPSEDTLTGVPTEPPEGYQVESRGLEAGGVW